MGQKTLIQNQHALVTFEYFTKTQLPRLNFENRQHRAFLFGCRGGSISKSYFVGRLMTSLQAQQALMLPVAALRTTRREHLMEQDRRTLKILQGKKEKTPNQALRNPKRKRMRYHSLISTITQVCLKLLLFTYPSVCSLVTLR